MIDQDNTSAQQTPKGEGFFSRGRVPASIAEELGIESRLLCTEDLMDFNSAKYVIPRADLEPIRTGTIDDNYSPNVYEIIRGETEEEISLSRIEDREEAIDVARKIYRTQRNTIGLLIDQEMGAHV